MEVGFSPKAKQIGRVGGVKGVHPYNKDTKKKEPGVCDATLFCGFLSVKSVRVLGFGSS